MGNAEVWRPPHLLQGQASLHLQHAGSSGELLDGVMVKV